MCTEAEMVGIASCRRWAHKATLRLLTPHDHALCDLHSLSVSETCDFSHQQNKATVTGCIFHYVM